MCYTDASTPNEREHDMGTEFTVILGELTDLTIDVGRGSKTRRRVQWVKVHAAHWVGGGWGYGEVIEEANSIEAEDAIPVGFYAPGGDGDTVVANDKYGRRMEAVDLDVLVEALDEVDTLEADYAPLLHALLASARALAASRIQNLVFVVYGH